MQRIVLSTLFAGLFFTIGTACAALPVNVSTMLTPGVARFVISGLSLGAGPQAVQNFLDSKGLRPTSSPDVRSIPGAPGKKDISYTSACSYTNNKSGAEKIEVTLGFTPPFPSAEGVVSHVSRIHYTTYFGAGVKVNEIKTGLIERFGKSFSESPNGMNMSWPLSVVGPAPPDIGHTAADLSAQISPSDSTSDYGRLVLDLTDFVFSWKSDKLARRYAATGDSSSPTSEPAHPQDMTKPSY